MSAENVTLSSLNDEERKELIIDLVRDLFVTPRKMINKWAQVTRQTAQVRLAYPGQHLASLVTGIVGSGSAARGDDLHDGTEVKTCSRVDQLGECKKCGDRVPSYEQSCSNCGSKQIQRKTDSHWIFPIKTEDELNRLISLPKILLVLFDGNDNDGIKVRIWQLNPQDNYVQQFFNNYYYNNYAVKMQNDKTPAPCNLHPLKYDFYLMNPCLIFDLVISEDDIIINTLNLKNSDPEPVPISILTKKEITDLMGKLNIQANPRAAAIEKFQEEHQYLTEEMKKHLAMRPKKTKENQQKYERESERT